MTRSRAITFLASAAAMPLLALAVAACGGGAVATAAPAASRPTLKTANAEMPTVLLATSSLGSILVDSAGRTLYVFKADSGAMSTCTGPCASAWPPLRSAGNATAAGGASAALIGTTPRSDGAPQVTYDGHPLYLYWGDKKPGELSGQGVVAFGAAWYVVSPAGRAITTRSTNSSTGSGSVY